MSVSHIPVAIWRKPSPNYTTQAEFVINLELVKHFINLDDGLPTPHSEEKKIKRSTTPSKIPILIHSSLRNRSSDGRSSESESSAGTSSEGSVSSMSPSPSSPASSQGLSPRIEPSDVLDLLGIMKQTTTFPSTKSHKFKEHMNWLNPLPEMIAKGRRVIGTKDHVERIQTTFNTINGVTLYFLQQGIPSPTENSENDTSLTNDIYSSDLLHNELHKEERYQLLFTKNRNKRVNTALRGKVVEWIISAAYQFKYSVDTVYIAAFFIDAFLNAKTIKLNCWPLLGLTAFHMAGKIEEKKCVRLSAIWEKYINLVKVTLEEVEWMEGEIMKTVEYQMIPTTPKIFADLAFASRCITFSCAKSEELIKELCYDILLNSLLNYELSFIRSSYKAELAIQIATEYIMFYHGIFLKTGKSQTTGDLEIQKNAVKICCTLFRTILLQSPQIEEELSIEVQRGI